jgi:hypothetical protein
MQFTFFKLTGDPMKKLFLVSLLLTSAGFAQADSANLVNADGSALSAVCIAAVTSREAMFEKAAELGVHPLDTETLLCNGMTLSRFVGVHRAAEAKPAGYVFSMSDSTPVTELCMAALKSEQEYMQVKQQYFSKDDKVEAEVLCNGMPLTTFARKYRTPTLSISSR